MLAVPVLSYKWYQERIHSPPFPLLSFPTLIHGWKWGVLPNLVA